jgi:glutathione peroxidase
MASVYDFTVKNIRGKDVKLDAYKGKPLLIVNTASECGFTPQYKASKCSIRNTTARGSKSWASRSQFGAQEPGTEKRSRASAR